MSDTTIKTDASPRPARYNVRLEVPPGRPYDIYYAEKIPLLQIFEKAALSWENKTRSSLIGNLRHMMGLSRPMMAAECGVYRGHSLIACLRIAQELGVPVHFVALDSFEGLPALVQEDLDSAPQKAPYRKQTLFNDTSFDSVRRLVTEAGFQKKTDLVKGFFADTLKTIPQYKYDFVNIDCDLYGPHIECLEYFYPRMRQGGIIFFDDYHSADFPMAKLAIDKFLSDKDEKLFHLRYADDEVNHTKCYIEKH